MERNRVSVILFRRHLTKHSAFVFLLHMMSQTTDAKITELGLPILRCLFLTKGSITCNTFEEAQWFRIHFRVTRCRAGATFIYATMQLFRIRSIPKTEFKGAALFTLTCCMGQGGITKVPAEVEVERFDVRQKLTSYVRTRKLKVFTVS